MKITTILPGGMRYSIGKAAVPSTYAQGRSMRPAPPHRIIVSPIHGEVECLRAEVEQMRAECAALEARIDRALELVEESSTSSSKALRDFLLGISEALNGSDALLGR